MKKLLKQIRQFYTPHEYKVNWGMIEWLPVPLGLTCEKCGDKQLIRPVGVGLISFLFQFGCPGKKGAA